MNALTRFGVPMLLALVSTLIVGCQTRPAVVERAQTTAVQFRKNLADINPQIERTFATLAQLQRADVKVHGAAFDQYQNNLKILEELVQPIRYQSDRLRREGLNYFKAWSEEMVVAHSSGDRKSLELARSQAEDRYKLFMEYLDNGTDDFRQLYYQLKDIEEYLLPDVSSENIAKQKPLIDAAFARSFRVRGRIDLLDNEIKKWISGQ